MGKHGIYLEDLYVDPKYRNKGHGLALMKTLASICKENGYERLQWWCLKWNKPSIDFYVKKLKAKPQDDWTVYRVEGDALDSLSSLEDLYDKKNLSKNNNKRKCEDTTIKENKRKKGINDKTESRKKKVTSSSSSSSKKNESVKSIKEDPRKSVKKSNKI